MKRVIFTLFLLFLGLSVWADNNVTVIFEGTTATVTVDDNVAQYLTVTQSGAHVKIEQSSDVAEEITYTLSGVSSDGEFYMSGSYKATIELNGLTLTNTTPVYSGAAIHIQNSKRINVKVITGTTNTLADASGGSQKGCLYVKGHAEFKQQGTLNIVGNAKHAVKAGEYISVKNATINITSAVSDGISCNQYFLMESGNISISGTGDDGIQCDLDGDTSTGVTVDHEDEDSGNVYINGGTLTINCAATAAKGIKSAGDMYVTGDAVIDITTTGHGKWDETDLKAVSACCISADGNIDISGGTLTLTATGSGGKGMKCDNLMTISGGNITVVTSGGLYYNNGTTEYINYAVNTDHINDTYYSSPKGIRAGEKVTSGSSTTYNGGLTISGGTISVTTSGTNGEGIESKNYLNITDGYITVEANDDGINSAQDLTVSGGYIYSHSTKNDGMDANGNFYINGGLIYAIGATSPEVALDANTEEGKKLYITGGTIITIGGLEQGSQLSQTCYSASSWSANKWYSLSFGSSVIAFKTPSSGGNSLIVSSASTPTVKSDVTVSSGTSIFGGKCYLDAIVSGGNNVTLTQYNGGGGGGTPPGPGGNSYTITASANPTEGGSVSGAGTYNRFATCTLTATANSGYTFTNWTRNGNVVSTNATYSFQVNGNASYVANFTLNSYTVTATANPSQGGSVTGAGTFDHGTSVTLTAVANEGYNFVNWIENGEEVATQASYTFVITNNRNLVANFEEYNPIPEEGAYLTIASYTPDAAPVDEETNISLSLKNLGVDPTDDITTVALYCDDERMTIINSTAELDIIASNETVTLQDAFSFIIAEGVANGTQFQIDVEMTCGTDTWIRQIYVTAIGDVCMLYFDLADSYGDGWNNASLTVSFSDGSDPQTITMSSGSTASNEIEVGNGVHVTLTWTKGRYDSECSFTMSYEGDLVIYQLAQGSSPNAGVLYEFDCNCAIATQTFNVNVSCDASQGAVGGGGEYSFGQSCTVNATPNEGYFFVGWTDNGTLVSASEEYTFNVSADMNLEANFIQAFEIGEGTANNNYLPSYSWYKQSLTEQIYTADEIGVAGTINSVAFYNEGAERTRTYDFYLATTTKDSFTSKNDWIAVVESDKVFSGNVTMAANAWTFISFDTPFEYDGVSNLVLVADDNSGRYDSSPYMACSVFNTSINQAIYYWDDNIDFNPMSPPTSSSSSGWNNPNDVVSVKNHILFGIEVIVPQMQQILGLAEGWNWVSFNVEITVDDLKTALVEALPGTVITIKQKNSTTSYDPARNRWTGNVTWDLSQMYEIKTISSCDITLEGLSVNPSERSAIIMNGANWIAFPLKDSMSLTNAFAGFAVEGDMIKSKDGTATYTRGRWVGTSLTTLEPGKGYIYKSSVTDNRTLTFPTSSSK